MGTANLVTTRFTIRVEVYFEPRDVWIGAYLARDAVYVCPLPCLVIKSSGA
jgi:hypothetical protein